MSDIINKRLLRESIMEEIASMTDEYISYSDKGIFTHVTSLEQFQSAKTIMMFYSVNREPDTIEISRVALAAGKTVAFPHCYKNGIMIARQVNDLSELKPAMLGIPAPSNDAKIIEPKDLDLIIVPALTFDFDGYRLGYGGGYYDRYLMNISAYTVGIARLKLVMDEVPREPHDVAVKCLVTEDKIIAPKC